MTAVHNGNAFDACCFLSDDAYITEVVRTVEKHITTGVTKETIIP